MQPACGHHSNQNESRLLLKAVICDGKKTIKEQTGDVGSCYHSAYIAYGSISSISGTQQSTEIDVLVKFMEPNPEYPLGNG